MPAVYKISDNIISSLGFDTSENFRSIVSGQSGIRFTDSFPSPAGGTYMSLVSREKLRDTVVRYADPVRYTTVEQMIIASVHAATDNCNIDMSAAGTLIVISTVKGNIDLIGNNGHGSFDPSRVHLWSSGEAVREHFNNPNTPVIISSACISGTLAVVYARIMLMAGHYKNIVVTGADEVSEFVVSGFECLKALDTQPCRPFDRDRKGLSLGEGAATIVLSTEKRDSSIVIHSGSSTNDANHISGPSRTGEGLFNSIKRTLGGEEDNKPDFINAHGTGTIFNDEMESIAFSRCGLGKTPVNSLKGYLGHTLGAAGIIETALCCRSLEENMLVASHGFENQGTSVPLNMIRESHSGDLTSCLKTSSGFGGTNATLMLKKIPR